MNMYVLQIRTNYEDDVVEILRSQGYKVYFPKQIKYIRHCGDWIIKTENIFKSYIFLECIIDEISYEKIKNTQYVIKVLKIAGSNKLATLKEKEVKFIKWLHNDGVPIEPIKVKFVKNKMIICDPKFNDYKIEIIKYSKRQKRVKVKINFLEEDKIITFSILNL